MKKYCRAGRATDDNIVHALCMLDNVGEHGMLGGGSCAGDFDR